MIKYLYHPYVRIVMLLLTAAFIMAACDPHDGPDWGRY